MKKYALTKEESESDNQSLEIMHRKVKEFKHPDKDLLSIKEEIISCKEFE